MSRQPCSRAYAGGLRVLATARRTQVRLRVAVLRNPPRLIIGPLGLRPRSPPPLSPCRSSSRRRSRVSDINGRNLHSLVSPVPGMRLRAYRKCPVSLPFVSRALPQLYGAICCVILRQAYTSLTLGCTCLPRLNLHLTPSTCEPHPLASFSSTRATFGPLPQAICADIRSFTDRKVHLL